MIDGRTDACWEIELPSLIALNQDLSVDFRRKILPPEALLPWRQQVRTSGLKLVVTNGCFDILHLGHVTYLETARNLGDLLLIGVNSDSAVRALKGSGRPVNPEADRLAVLAALESVDAVTLFNQSTATAFLSQAQPDIYVKGGDYSRETMNQEERAEVEKAGGEIQFIPFVKGRSTTSLLKKLGSA